MGLPFLVSSHYYVLLLLYIIMSNIYNIHVLYMCFIFYRITEGATIITRDNNVSYFTIKREGGKKCSFNREHKRYINNMYSSLLYLL